MLQWVRLSKWLGIALVQWTRFIDFGLAQRVTDSNNMAVHAVEVRLIGNKDRQEQPFTGLFDRRKVLRDRRKVAC